MREFPLGLTWAALQKITEAIKERKRKEKLLYLLGHLCLKQIMENGQEDVLLSKVQGLVANVKWSLTDAADLFVALLERFDWRHPGRPPLLPWLLEILHLIEINFITPTWKCRKGSALGLVRDPAVTDEELKDYLSREEEKQLDKIIEEIRRKKLNQVDERLLSEVKDVVSAVSDALHSKKHAQLHGMKGDLLRVSDAAGAAHFRPRLTQMVSWCIMALSETGRFIQVSTGEGKSCIVAMFAAYRALKGDKVHVLTSSPVLAERDMDTWKKLFDKLGISVDCNTNKHDMSGSQKCYKCQVVYGTAEKFAGDLLRQKDIFGKGKLCAIVDEEDSIMLDKALHVIYISSDMPALQHLNSLLAFIWTVVNRYGKIGAEAFMGPKRTFLQVVLDITKDNPGQLAIFQMAEDAGVLPKGSTKALAENPTLLMKKITHATVSQLASFFQVLEAKLPCLNFALHCQSSDGSLQKLNSPHKEGSTPLLLLDGGICRHLYRDQQSLLKAIKGEVEDAIRFTPCDLTRDKRWCYVPGFLSEVVRSKLDVWIRNALVAQQMNEDEEYVVEGHGVVPVDYSSTGVIENFTKWSDGLHQFLELKHKLKLSNMEPISNYKSNVGLLQMYKGRIFGLTGTLGQQAEMETLQKLYGVKTCEIPTFKRKKLFEVEGVVVNGEKDWLETICKVVSEQIQATSYRGPRAALIICETISRAKTIHRSLGEEAKKSLFISNNMDNEALFDNMLTGGDVVIATNLAGRGADFKVSDQVNAAGGLFVVQTFLPENSRVEAQAFGRTARQGHPGSAQLVVCCSHLSQPFQQLHLLNKLLSFWENVFRFETSRRALFVSMLKHYQRTQIKIASHLRQMLVSNLSKTSHSEINEVKGVRDRIAAQKLATLLEDAIPNMAMKETLLQEFLCVRDEMAKHSSESELTALNEYWGFWLLTNSNQDGSAQELNKKLSKDLDEARTRLKKGESPFSNLHHYTVAGNELLKKGRFEQSIQMYTKAVEEDPCWAAFAYYNRAFARLRQSNRQDQRCIRQAMEDLQQAQVSLELYINQTDFTQRCYKQAESNPNPPVSRFDIHIKTRQKVFTALKENIDVALKKLDRARAMGSLVKVDESLVHLLIVHALEDMFYMVVLLCVMDSRNPREIHQLQSNPAFDFFLELQCLDSLGLPHIYTLDTVFSVRGFLSKIFTK